MTFDRKNWEYGHIITADDLNRIEEGIEQKSETGPAGPKGDTGPAGPKGDTGPAYVLTEDDKNAIAEAVKNSITKENWKFTLDNGDTVTKAVHVG